MGQVESPSPLLLVKVWSLRCSRERIVSGIIPDVRGQQLQGSAKPSSRAPLSSPPRPLSGRPPPGGALRPKPASFSSLGLRGSPKRVLVPFLALPAAMASILKAWFREPQREPLSGVHGAHSVFTIILRELPILLSFSHECTAEFSRGSTTRSQFSKKAVGVLLPPSRLLSLCGGVRFTHFKPKNASQQIGGEAGRRVQLCLVKPDVKDICKM